MLRSSTALVVCGVLSAGLLDGGLAAHAQQRWDGDGSSDWGTAGNWDGGGVPVSSSNVRIDASGSTFQPTIVDARTIRSLDMRSGTLSISGTAASLAVDSFFGGGTVDVTGGTINILDGGSLSAERGISIDGGGTVNVGTNSELDADVTSEGTFSNAGTVMGNLEVNGGTVTNLASGELHGDVTINGGELINDNRIFGTLTINNGGTATNNETVSGLVTVEEGGALTNTTGSGLNGGLVNSGTSINHRGGTITTVVNTDGTFTNAGTVTETLEVNGGIVTNLGTGELHGAVTVNGGELINDNRIFGTLTINNGGTATNNETVGGLVTVEEGGALTNTTGSGLNGGLVNSGTSINHQGGTITTIVNTDGTFSNAGTVTETLEVNGGIVTNLGTGELHGAVTVNGGELINGNVISSTLTVNSGGRVTNNELVFGLATVNVGGTLNNRTDGQLSGGLVNFGTSTNALDATIASVVNNAGTLSNSGTVTGTLEVNNGTVTNNAIGRIQGAVTVNGGELINNNLINSTVTVNNGGKITNSAVVVGLTTVNDGGILNNNSGSHLDGGLVNFGTSVNVAGGSIAGVINNAGTFTNSGTVAGAATISGGTITNTGQITGVTTVDAGGTLNNYAGGRLDGGLINSGVSVNAADGSVANVVNNAGTFTNSGTVAAATVNGGTLSNLNLISGTLTVNNGGAATNTGTISGLATVNTGGTLNNAGGQFDGGLVNSGMVTGAVTATRSTITNQAAGRMLDSVTVNGGEFVNFGTVEADVRNLAGVFQNSGTIAGTFANSDRAYVQGSVKGDISNKSGASFNLTGSLQASSGFVNEGTLASAGYNTIGGLQFFTNSSGGKLTIRDGLTISSAQTRFEQGSVIDMIGNGTSDSLTVNGNLQSQGATYNIDLIGVDQRVTADKIVVNGNLTGTGNLNFTVGGDLANGQRVLTGSPVTIFDVSGTNDSQFTVTGLPFEPGIIEYEMFKDGQDWVVSSGVNPNAGAIAGSLALINSMVGTVVNRPNSAFVGGLAYEAKPNECGVGPWSRGTGGSASISGTTTGGLEDQVSEVDAYYGGYQGGADFQCFNIGSSGWDVAIGGFGGFNMGRSKQAIDETSVTADFNQYYGGVYASAAKGQFVAELQTRFDYLDYTLNSPVLGLRDAGIDATRLTASGTASYAFTFGDYSLVPSAGASVSYLRTDDLVFRSRHSLSFENQWSVVGFGGVTLARSFLNADKTAAYRPFVTATVYSDFGAKANSTFYDPVSQVTQDLSSEGVGTFGEVSVGLDYLKILPESSFLKARQLNATVRGDLKFSDRLLSGGATVQLRLQF
ncbi:hypothetical protein L4923_03330 [Mesorhizobium sp. IRAMC:0171]|uniref:Autotransporter domain-containing protein n=1 Tax=Mesorhizobium retamae TaxID=2912854 RepID=A0ABS9QAV7_9HYPH|nr:hypothetical protein [Mesorhizobium sp. IRAMC:0171]